MDRATPPAASPGLQAPIAVVRGPEQPIARTGLWSRKRILTTVLVMLVVCSAAGAAGYWQDEAHRNQVRLAATQHDLAGARHQVTETTASLDQTRGQLDQARAKLSDTTGRLRTAQGKLRDTRQEAAGLQGSLDSAQDRLDLQANQIDTLKSCLSGVVTSMGYAGQGDYGAAIAALDAVEISCQRADDFF